MLGSLLADVGVGVVVGRWGGVGSWSVAKMTFGGGIPVFAS